MRSRHPIRIWTRDDEVSIQEAFLRASAQTEQFYNEAGRISTEHALIDDNADARGTPAAMFRGTRPIAQAKDNAPLDGRAAARQTFTQSELTQRTDLETQLETLMLQLAKLYQAAEQRQSDAK